MSVPVCSSKMVILNFMSQTVTLDVMHKKREMMIFAKILVRLHISVQPGQFLPCIHTGMTIL